MNPYSIRLNVTLRPMVLAHEVFMDMRPKTSLMTIVPMRTICESFMNQWSQDNFTNAHL
jgi:hypothetical protein